ncbi:hypothetical protein CRUP_004176 [Coryphaenoides rupestris]|nr:hypothetical protein CRUP_004176 [Coryphaenoides rupestris]
MTGSAISKAVCKATTHEVSGPKKKHLDYLIHCTNELNVSVPHLADTLLERTASHSWVVVFKALITTHHLMMYGNERLIQYLASRNTLFNLNNFLDKSALQGYDMSTFIRRYSRYLNEKAMSYRLVAVDFTKMKRGADGVMRTMNTEKLIKTLPIIQNQLDALLDFQGVINMLEKYFDMKKNQCKEALEIYKTFLNRMTKLSEFLKVAEAPSSLLEALEQHLASLEGRKIKELSASNSTGISLSRMEDKTDDNRLQQHKSVGSANSNGGANDLFANSTIVPISNQPELQWSQLVEKKPSGGSWQSKGMCTSTNWAHATHAMPPAPMAVPQMAPAPVAFPMTTSQVPVYGMLPPQMGHQMGAVPMMAPQPVMYNQPVLRPTNPFAPIPGTQMHFM